MMGVIISEGESNLDDEDMPPLEDVDDIALAERGEFLVMMACFECSNKGS